jgi:tetratricopeptide (TPR) repeat protein
LALFVQKDRFSMSLLGPFRLEGPRGISVGVTSKKGIALLAILATSPNGERSRGWLQYRLWGSRGETQASASLRRELSNLRKGFEQAGFDLIETDGGRIRLKMEAVDVDVLRHGREGWVRAERTAPDSEFLEGLDIRGEEGFETWLANMRAALSNFPAEEHTPPASPGTPDKAAANDAGPASEASDAAALVLLAPLELRIHDSEAARVARAFDNEFVSQLVRLRWLRIVSLEKTPPSGSGRIDYNDDPDACFIVERAIVGENNQQSAEIRLLRSRSREMIFAERLPFHEATGPDPTVTRLVARFVTRIEREEQSRAVRLPENNADFRNLIWRGRWHVNRLTSRDAAIARVLFERAVALSPNALEGRIEKAISLCWEKWAKRSPREEFREIADLARRIMLLDPDDCRGYWIAAIAESWLGNLPASLVLLKRAVEIAPSFEPAHAQLGTMLNLLDRPEEALEAVNLALTLSPNDTHLFFRYSEMAMAWLRLRHYDRAIDWSDRALILRPGYWYAQTIKIHALVQGGDWEAAHRMGEEFCRSHPNFNQDYLEWVPFFDRTWVQWLSASVHIATDGALCPTP